MKLAFTEREVFGKKVAALRRGGVLPVVCYGNAETPKHCTLPLRSFEQLLATDEVLIEGDGVLSGKKVVLQSFEVHPVTGIPLHADFLFVDAKHAIEHEVPIHITGEAPAVKVAGGEIIVVLGEVLLRGLPQDIPGHLEAEVGGLTEIGAHLLASDLKLPKGLELLTNPEEIIISIVGASEEEESAGPVDMETIEVAGKGKKKEGESADGSDA